MSITETQESIHLSIEERWTTFLNSLPAWERHFVFHMELELHDLYMQGDLTFEGVREYASSHFADPGPIR
jgi:hypothetical protein